MSCLIESMETFLEKLSSRSPTPGGGSASALVGAVGAALCGMVGRLNDKKTGEPGPLHETVAAADELLGRLKRLVVEDMEAFGALMASWRLPNDDPQKDARMQTATVAATRTPLEIMSAAFEVMKLAAVGLDKSKKNCLSDACVAALLAHACLEGARMNVLINLPGIADPNQRAALRDRSDQLRDEANTLRRTIDQKIDTYTLGLCA